MSGSDLPLSYRRLPRDPRDHALDAITVDPRSSGQLHLPGTYSNLTPPPAYRYRISPTGDHGVEAAPVQTGTTREYVVRVDIQNHRQSALTVRLYWVKEPDAADLVPPEAVPRRRRVRAADTANGSSADRSGGEALHGEPRRDGTPVGGPEEPPGHPSPEDEADRVLAELSGAPSQATPAGESASLPEDQIAEMVEEANDTDR